MAEPIESPIFISYSRQDHGYVERLIAAFEKRGLSVWLDNRIDYGAAWQREIEKHLEACQAFVLVMTPRAHESHWVACELSVALELKKPIFPLLLEGRMWLGAAAIQTVDVTGGTLPPKRFFDAVSASVIGMEISKPGEESLNVAETVSVRKAEQFSGVASAVLDAKYANLERYLKNGQWREADDETYRLMIMEVGKEEGQRFGPEALLNFPCKPLRVIDELWVRHSNGKFGFSVQTKLYLDCGGVADGSYHEEAWDKFCEANGWQVEGTYASVRFDVSSPIGHLPHCNLPKIFQNQFPIIMSVEKPTLSTFYSAFSSLVCRVVDCDL